MDNLMSNSVIPVPELSKSISYATIPHRTIHEILVFRTANEASLALAVKHREIARVNPGKQMLWPTGNTPLDVYRWHRKLCEITGDNPLGKTLGRHLDEYYPCIPTAPHSFVGYIHKQLADPLSLPFEFMNGAASDPNTEARRYDAIISANAIAAVTMGTDETEGHIAFIKPGTPFTQRAVFYTTLSADTVRRDRVERHENTPDGAITQGYGMLDADRIFLIAFGKKGAVIKRALFETQPTPTIPLSILQSEEFCKKVTIFLDENAAVYLKNY